MPERGGSPGPEPLRPAELPPELGAFMRGHNVACLLQEANNGTAFVIKVPASEIRSVGGRVPLHPRHELYQHPAAPVIRTVLTIHDRANSALALETFTNIEQDDQRADFERLGRQTQIPLPFYDEQLEHRLTKDDIRAILPPRVVTWLAPATDTLAG